MIKKLLLFAVVVFVGKSLTAQVWTQQNTQFTDLATYVGVDQISIVDENIVWINGFNGTSTGGRIKAYAHTNDGGTTWVPGHFTQFTATEFPNVIAASSYDYGYAVVMDTVSSATSFWSTADGGTTWVKKTAMFTGASSFVDGVRFWDSQKGFAYGDPNGGKFEIYLTSDGGLTWTINSNAPAPSPANEYGFNGFECSATVAGGIGFIMTDHGRILKTTDYGTTWAPTPTAPFTSPATAFGSNKVYASSANYIICATYVTSTTTWTWKITTDGGTTWNAYTHAGAFYDFAMCYAPGSPNTFISTSPSTTTTMGVSYSTDGGLNWTDYTDALLQPSGTNIQCLGVGYATQQTGWVGNYDAGAAINSILKYYDPTVGVNLLNTINGNDVNIYPNPSNGVVNFSVNGPNNDNINIKVFDIVGKLVFSEIMNVNGLKNTSYNFSSYAKGMYIAHIQSGNDLKTQKFVVQ